MGPPAAEATLSPNNNADDAVHPAATDPAAGTGDLPMRKRKLGFSKTPVVEAGVLSMKDKGHRYGNFHNYYTFNPTQERMKLLEKSGGILDFVANNWNSTGDDVSLQTNNPEASQVPTTSGDASLPENKKPRIEVDSPTTAPPLGFNYLDVGCNEGDLTMEVAKALACRLSTSRIAKDDNEVTASKHDVILNAKGVDIDKELIDRAKHKYSKSTKTQENSILSSFQVSNVLSSDFAATSTPDNKEQHFHLTSIFSTTMWVHIHGGDEGLRRALGNICRCTKSFVLIEPQPSKW